MNYYKKYKKYRAKYLELKTNLQSGGGFKLQSNAFKHGKGIPKKFTCNGQNMTIPLSWSGAPKETKSFALIMEDPDTSSGPFIHWIAWNISKSANNLLGKKHISGKNSLDKTNYSGPCPPQGQTHRYYFRLYPLNIVKLDLKKETTVSLLQRVIDTHKIAPPAIFMGRYTGL